MSMNASELGLHLNDSRQICSRSENSSGKVPSTNEIIHILCYQFLDCDVAKSIPLAVCWFIIAAVSLLLNIVALRFFIQITKIHQLHEMLLANQLICHVSVGFSVQLGVGILYLYDNCLLRSLCVICSIIMANISIITLLFLTLNQLLNVTLYRASFLISKTKRTTAIVLVWLYCIGFVILKLRRPESFIPISFIAVMSLILFFLFLMTRKALLKARSQIENVENAVDNDGLLTLTSQVDDALKIIFLLQIATAVTWIPSSLIVLLTRLEVINQSAKMHIATKIALKIIFLPPLLDPLCIFVKNRRLRISLKTTVSYLLSLNRVQPNS